MTYKVNTGVISFDVIYMKGDIPKIGDTINDSGKSYIVTDVNEVTKIIEVVEITN